jgi:hypothetical protein
MRTVSRRRRFLHFKGGWNLTDSAFLSWVGCFGDLVGDWVAVLIDHNRQKDRGDDVKAPGRSAKPLNSHAARTHGEHSTNHDCGRSTPQPIILIEFVANRINQTLLTTVIAENMSYDPKARRKIGEYATELKIAKGFDVICDPSVDAATERLNLLKEQLLTLFLRLQRGDLCCTEVKAQSRCIQEELSKMIWAADDWQIQFASRN